MSARAPSTKLRLSDRSDGPRPSRVRRTLSGIAYCAAGDWEAAIPACGKSEQANPRFSLPYFLRAAALSQLGRIQEAKVPAQRGLELEPGFTVAGFVRAHTGRAEIWEPIGEALRRLGLPE